MIIIPIIYLVIIMKLKNSIIISLLTMFLGFIPMYQKDNDIWYEINAESISIANKIKEEMIMFYKEHCYSSLFDCIDEKINNNIKKLNYNCYYNDYVLKIDEGDKIKMTGYLYKSTPSSIKYKYYFSASMYSMPEATSINVATLSLSE